MSDAGVSWYANGWDQALAGKALEGQHPVPVYFKHYADGTREKAQHRYGAYDPSPVVSSRTCLASSTNEPGTNTSLGPAERKSGASKPGARWISDGTPASCKSPSISNASVSLGATATFVHLSST